VMQMSKDDVIDLLGRHTDKGQAVFDGHEQLTAALPGSLFLEAGVDDIYLAVAPRHPYVILKVGFGIVEIRRADIVVLRLAAAVARIPDGVEFKWRNTLGIHGFVSGIQFYHEPVGWRVFLQSCCSRYSKNQAFLRVASSSCLRSSPIATVDALRTCRLPALRAAFSSLASSAFRRSPSSARLLLARPGAAMDIDLSSMICEFSKRRLFDSASLPAPSSRQR